MRTANGAYPALVLAHFAAMGRAVPVRRTHPHPVRDLRATVDDVPGSLAALPSAITGRVGRGPIARGGPAAPVGRAAERRGAGDGPGRPLPDQPMTAPAVGAALLTLVLLWVVCIQVLVQRGWGAPRSGFRSADRHAWIPRRPHGRRVAGGPGRRADPRWAPATRPETRDRRRIRSGDLRTPRDRFLDPGRRRARRRVLDRHGRHRRVDPPRPPPRPGRTAPGSWTDRAARSGRGSCCTPPDGSRRAAGRRARRDDSLPRTTHSTARTHSPARHAPPTGRPDRRPQPPPASPSLPGARRGRPRSDRPAVDRAAGRTGRRNARVAGGSGPQRVDDPDDRQGSVVVSVSRCRCRRCAPATWSPDRPRARREPVTHRLVSATRQGDTYLMQTRATPARSGETWTVPADSTRRGSAGSCPASATASRFCARTWCWCSGWWSSAGCSSPRCGSRPDDTAHDDPGLG